MTGEIISDETYRPETFDKKGDEEKDSPPEIAESAPAAGAFTEDDLDQQARAHIAGLFGGHRPFQVFLLIADYWANLPASSLVLPFERAEASQIVNDMRSLAVKFKMLDIVEFAQDEEDEPSDFEEVITLCETVAITKPQANKEKIKWTIGQLNSQ